MYYIYSSIRLHVWLFEEWMAGPGERRAGALTDLKRPHKCQETMDPSRNEAGLAVLLKLMCQQPQIDFMNQTRSNNHTQQRRKFRDQEFQRMQQAGTHAKTCCRERPGKSWKTEQVQELERLRAAATAGLPLDQVEATVDLLVFCWHTVRLFARSK